VDTPVGLARRLYVAEKDEDRQREIAEAPWMN
jgi:hypothetical protein